MKSKILYVLIAALAFLQSCEKDANVVQPIDLVYQLDVDPNVVGFDIPYEKAVVVITKKSNNEKYTGKPTSDGTVNFNAISPGVYNVNVSLTLTADEVTTLSGQAASEDLHLNFSGDNLTYYQSSTAQIRLITSKPVGNFVFKQIYYAGSHTTDGAGVRDFFVEIYNNSNETLYADSLCFAVVYGKANNNTGDFLLPNFQFDWTQSLNMNVTGNANTDYIYAKAIFMIPSDGTGKQYPVEPGKSFIIAESALDHTKPYTLNSDKVQEIADATLTVDLSKADFEVYMHPYEQKIQPGRTKFASDVDNPNVKDVETIFATGMRDMILNPQGKESYVLFKLGDIDIANIPSFAQPTVRTISDNTTLYPQIPVNLLVDAVELSSVIEKDKSPRRLQLSEDAGNAEVTGGPFSSQSIVRKTKQVLNGRRILMDTNNSSKDFGVLSRANTSKGAESFID
jgi:hypothetical protein